MNIFEILFTKNGIEVFTYVLYTVEQPNRLPMGVNLRLVMGLRKKMGKMIEMDAVSLNVEITMVSCI